MSDGQVAATKFTPTAVASGICMCSRCEARTQERYRMVGTCYNCGAHVLMLYRFGDPASPLDCPVCGCYREVRSQRLATDDEIPVDFEQGFMQVAR